jgi:hypothetical protein
MHRLLSRLFFIFIVMPCCLLTSATAGTSAAVPPLIKVSGTLPDTQRIVGVIFALYAEQAGGAPLWLETQNVTPNDKGHYMIYLGANHANGVPLDLFVSGEARWLGVQPEGQAEQARVELVSVPYALKAADAETLGGHPLSAFMLASSVSGGAAMTGGSGGATPNASGNSTPSLVITTAGSTNYLTKFFDEMGDIENSLVFDSGAGVGIGTTTPAAMLHVATSTPPAAYFDIYSGSPTTALNVMPTVNRAARGTPGSPSAVQYGDYLAGMAARGYGSTGFASGGRAALRMQAAETWTDKNQGTYMSFWTSATGSTVSIEHMRIDPFGNVGIGTQTPAATLEVNGTAQFDGPVTFAAGQTFPGIKASNITGAVATQGTPANSSAACTPPQIMYDSSYIYTCVATNTWRRAASAAF